LYPFLSPRSLPWTMNAAGAFRVRKVGEWRLQSSSEDVSQTGGLASSKGHLLTKTRDLIDLKEMMMTALPDPATDLPGCQKSFKASLGHVLFTTRSPAQKATLVPPFKGNHELSKIVDWMTSHDGKKSFVSSLPASLVHAPPSKQRVLHRLEYQALIPHSSSRSHSPTGQDTEMKLSPVIKTLTMEVCLSEPKVASSTETVDSQSEDAPTSTLELQPLYQHGEVRICNLMMPDRPMDMQLSVINAAPLTGDLVPAALQNYVYKLREYLYANAESQSDPPIVLEFRGEGYVLHSNTSIRQSTEVGRPEHHFSSEATTDVITESVLDLENSQKATKCEISCKDTVSADAWQRFLELCDRLSSAVYRPSRFTLGEPLEKF